MAKEYAHRLAELSGQVSDTMLLVMRTYFEKPRTNVGWEGLMNDPDMNGTMDINKGLHVSRTLLAYVNDQGIPAATEYLDTATPQFNSDLISYAAMCARTAESQLHRHMDLGLSMPVGLKNGTKGNIDIAVDAAIAARNQHIFPGLTPYGSMALVETRGNPYAHIILRGGLKQNYDAEALAAAQALLCEKDCPLL